MDTHDGAGVHPTPVAVAGLVARLVASDWPTTEEERRRWFREHGIPQDDARLVRETCGAESWQGGGPDGSGWPGAGWQLFDGEFVGVGWFLWHGLPDQEVVGRAQELRNRLVDLAGAPLDAAEEVDGYRFRALWERDDRSVELYLHGGPVLGGELSEGPVVQLHVDHVPRSRRADEAARAAHGADGAWPARDPR